MTDLTSKHCQFLLEEGRQKWVSLNACAHPFAHTPRACAVIFQLIEGTGIAVGNTSRYFLCNGNFRLACRRNPPASKTVLSCIIKFQYSGRCACKSANDLDEHGRQKNMVNVEDVSMRVLNTSQIVSFLHLASHKSYHVLKVGPSFSMTLYSILLFVMYVALTICFRVF
jgi:hypothetical protein